MQSKSLLIAIAAFAVTTTGVYAYGGGDILEKAGLSEEQKSALEQAHELRKSGDVEAARDVLVEAGIDENVLRAIHQARHEGRKNMHEALAAGDYDAFKTAIAGSPLAEIITTEADFEQFKQAHALKDEGELEEAKILFDELGVDMNEKRQRHHKAVHAVMSSLSDEQKEALQVARQANDRETVQAIFDEAGVDFPPRHR